MCLDCIGLVVHLILTTQLLPIRLSPYGLSHCGPLSTHAKVVVSFFFPILFAHSIYKYIFLQ